jgi:hypothetical protein
LPARALFQPALAFRPAKIKIELIAEKSTRERTQDYPWQFEITAMRGKSTKDENSFTLKESAYSNRGITIR